MSRYDDALSYLKRNSNRWISPTEIGLSCGARYDCASGCACDAINRMAAKGWVIYKRLIGAQITEEGLKALEG